MTMAYYKRFTNGVIWSVLEIRNLHFYAWHSQARAVRKRSGFVFSCKEIVDTNCWLTQNSRHSCLLQIDSEPTQLAKMRKSVLWNWGPSRQIHGFHSKTTYSSRLKFGDFSSLSISHLLKEFQLGTEHGARSRLFFSSWKNLKTKNFICP